MPRSPVRIGAFAQQRGEVAAVDAFVADARHARQGVQGGAQVDGPGDGLHLRAGGDPSGPADEQGGADAAFVGRAFLALHPAGPSRGVRSVVGKIDDDRVVLEVQFLEFRQDATDVAVLVLEHGPDAAGGVGFLVLRIGRGLGDGLVLAADPILRRYGKRRVRRREGHVAQEGLGFVAVDELQRLFGQDVDDVALRGFHHPVVLERGVEIFAPVAGRVAPEGIEAAGERVVRPLAAVVPFAEDPRDVAGGLERVGEGLFVEVHALLSGGDPVDAEPPMVAAGQEFGTGGGADGLDEETVEVRAGLGEGVDVGRGHLAIAVERVIAPAGVVGQQHDHVGRGRGREPADEQEQAGEEQAHGLISWPAGSRARPGNRRRPPRSRRTSTC